MVGCTIAEPLEGFCDAVLMVERLESIALFKTVFCYDFVSFRNCFSSPRVDSCLVTCIDFGRVSATLVFKVKFSNALDNVDSALFLSLEVHCRFTGGYRAFLSTLGLVRVII